MKIHKTIELFQPSDLPKKGWIQACFMCETKTAKMFDYKIVYTDTQGMDIDNIISMSKYLHQPTDMFLMKWKHELQAMINAAQCADSLRIILKKS